MGGGGRGGAQGLSQREMPGHKRIARLLLCQRPEAPLGQETVGRSSKAFPGVLGAGQPVVVSVWLRMKGVLHAAFEREAGRLEPPQREQGRKVGGEGTDVQLLWMEGLGESLWGALGFLSSHKPSGKPHYLLRPPGAGILIIWDAGHI